MTVPRAIGSHPASVHPNHAVPAAGRLKDWIEEQAKTHQLQWLLAHCDDGVVWGRIDDGHLITSFEAVPAASPIPPVGAELWQAFVQQLRLFGENAELLLWRDGDGAWQARLIQEPPAGAATWEQAIDERMLLLGNPSPDRLEHGFTLFEDRGQGFRHAVPVATVGPGDPPRLVVRHYLARGAFARIVASRLVSLE